MKLKKVMAGVLAGMMVASSAAMTVSALEAHGTGIKMRDWLTNDPNYTFSEDYKKTVWYDNFSLLELTGNERNDILSIAISQLGYHEGEDGDYSGTNQSSSGNCVEYYRLLIPNWSNNSDEWCACFVNWCLNQAHIDYASSEIGCWKWVGELKTMKMFQDSAAYGGTYTPQPADMIFFNWKNTNTGSGHIGYVLYTTDTHVFTIEGNADNKVMIRSYELNSPSVIGYGTPPYKESDIPTIDHSYKDGMPRGEYVVNEANLSLTDSPSGSRLARIPLGGRVTLLAEDGDYAKVSYDGTTGYVKKANLYLLSKAVGEDTVTFDANGGEGAPEAIKVKIGETLTVSEAAPTLEGDTFLGWSYTAHNYKVDVKAGDVITTAGDTTLYAVWEKRSLQLAKDAIAAGNVAEFERPAAIENSSALLLGTLESLDCFDTAEGDTKVAFHKDEVAGRVVALSSTAASKDPFVTLSYKSLCESLRLAPVNADKVDAIVLKVKDVSMSNLTVELFYDCGDGAVNSVSRTLKSGNDWQYLVFDMSSAEGWDGELASLRIDWQKNAAEADSTMLIADLFFAAGDAEVDALKAGAYIYLPQEKLPEETETTAPDGTTADSSLPVGPVDPEAPTTDIMFGCQSAAGISALVGIAVAGLSLCLRKKED